MKGAQYLQGSLSLLADHMIGATDLAGDDILSTCW
jgi:hypothetical protein